MASTTRTRKPLGAIIMVIVAVGATLLPAAILIDFIRNLLQGDPPAYLWVIVYGAALVIGIVGSVLFGAYLWHSPQTQKPRLLTMGLIGVGIAFGVVLLTIVTIPF